MARVAAARNAGSSVLRPPRRAYPQLTAPGTRPPVHVANAVAGDEATQIGELDAFALLPRHMVAGEDLGLVRPQEVANRFFSRIHLQRQPPVDGRLVAKQTEDILCPHEHPAEAIGAPASAGDAERQLSRLPVGQMENARIASFQERKILRQLEQHIDPLRSHLGLEPHLHLQLVALERALTVELDLHPDLGSPDQDQAQHRNEREGRCDDRELRQTGTKGGEEAERGEPRVRGELRRREPVHSRRTDRSSAAGVGTVSSSSRTTSSGRTC